MSVWKSVCSDLIIVCMPRTCGVLSITLRVLGNGWPWWAEARADLRQTKHIHASKVRDVSTFIQLNTFSRFAGWLIRTNQFIFHLFFLLFWKKILKTQIIILGSVTINISVTVQLLTYVLIQM